MFPSLYQTKLVNIVADLVTIAEAMEYSAFSHEHIAYLVRHKKINGRKSGKTWLVDLEALRAYEKKMKALGTQKHSPTKN